MFGLVVCGRPVFVRNRFPPFKPKNGAPSKHDRLTVFFLWTDFERFRKLGGAGGHKLLERGAGRLWGAAAVGAGAKAAAVHAPQLEKNDSSFGSSSPYDHMGMGQN